LCIRIEEETFLVYQNRGGDLLCVLESRRRLSLCTEAEEEERLEAVGAKVCEVGVSRVADPSSKATAERARSSCESKAKDDELTSSSRPKRRVENIPILYLNECAREDDSELYLEMREIDSELHLEMKTLGFGVKSYWELNYVLGRCYQSRIVDFSVKIDV